MLHGRYVCQRKNHSGEVFFVDRGLGMDVPGMAVSLELPIVEHCDVD